MSSAAGQISLPRYDGAGRVTQARVALSEWTKLHSLRSTRWSLLVATVLTIGLPMLFASDRRLALGSHEPAGSARTGSRSTSPSPA